MYEERMAVWVEGRRGTFNHSSEVCEEDFPLHLQGGFTKPVLRSKSLEKAHPAQSFCP